MTTKKYSIDLKYLRHDGPQGLPLRGSDHEEAPPSQTDPAVRRVHQRGAHLHHH